VNITAVLADIRWLTGARRVFILAR